MSQISKMISSKMEDPTYASLPGDEAGEAGSKVSLESDIPLIEGPNLRRRPSRFRKVKASLRRCMSHPWTMANLLLFQLSMGGLALMWHEKHRLNAHLKDISLHSPLLDRISIPLASRMSYAQYGMGGPEIWRAEPSEEVDKAWERVTAEYIFPVKESDIVAMRKDPSVVVPLPDKYHIDGEKTYLAKAAVFHNVHCLDYIRRAVYKDHYYPNGTDDNPFHAYHTAHCIMILLEHLTCSGDSGVYLYRWMDEFNRPIADTNIWRKCWDFETLLQEHNDKAIQEMTETDIRKPPGVKSVPAPEGVMNIINGYRKKHPGYNPGQ